MAWLSESRPLCIGIVLHAPTAVHVRAYIVHLVSHWQKRHHRRVYRELAVHAALFPNSSVVRFASVLFPFASRALFGGRWVSGERSRGEVLNIIGASAITRGKVARPRTSASRLRSPRLPRDGTTNSRIHQARPWFTSARRFARNIALWGHSWDHNHLLSSSPLLSGFVW